MGYLFIFLVRHNTTYKYDDESLFSQVESMISAGDGDEEEVVSADNNGNETKAPLTWRQRWTAFWDRKKMLVMPPYIGLLVLCCFVDFGLMFR